MLSKVVADRDREGSHAPNVIYFNSPSAMNYVALCLCAHYCDYDVSPWPRFSDSQPSHSAATEDLESLLI
jgi:hypothetical protein